MYRLYRDFSLETKEFTDVLIIGAGQAADGLIRDMRTNPNRQYRPMGLLDDDVTLHHRSMHGIRVLGAIDQLHEVIERYKPGMVVVAIPSLSSNDLLNTVYEQCNQQKVSLRVLPGLKQLADGRVSVDALRKVSIEDLLGRDPISLLDEKLISRFDKKIVMVTGGGGSIGSELCRQIATNRPGQLVILENNEFNLYKIERELKQNFPALQLVALLADVSNFSELERVIQHTTPQIIFHAAAFKHVPLLEYQIFSAIKNNVMATRHLADLADRYQVENFILVSTDKAVNPTNIMGMSKRIGEMYCQEKDKHSKTNFSTVRFGNVLGSAGSVLPLFREQLEQGGPLTVTDPKMTRYFMMIPEAVSLILQSFLIGQGGEIFVLDMGQPVKIVDLAEKLITLSGKIPYQQIDIQFTGIRPGEKLFEELFYDAEHLLETPLDKVFQSNCREYSQHTLHACFSAIDEALNQSDQHAALAAMCSLVPEYTGAHQISSERVTATV